LISELLVSILTSLYGRKSICDLHVSQTGILWTSWIKITNFKANYRIKHLVNRCVEFSTYPKMTSIDILSDISSGPRLQILHSLKGNSLKAIEISKKTNSSIQALSRHIDKLVESKLIEKTPDGKYKISTIGKIALSQIPFFEFLSKNKEYFETHDFTGIPDHLISRIGELANCKLEPDFMKSLQRARQFCIDAEKFIFAATCTMPMEIYDILLEKRKDFQWINICGTNTIVAKGFSEYKARKEFLKKHDQKLLQEKIVKRIPIVCGVSEKGCQLLFSNKESGQIDGKGVFFGTDEKSLQWCRDLFDYYYSMSEIHDFKLIEK